MRSQSTHVKRLRSSCLARLWSVFMACWLGARQWKLFHTVLKAHILAPGEKKKIESASKRSTDFSAWPNLLDVFLFIYLFTKAGCMGQGLEVISESFCNKIYHININLFFFIIILIFFECISVKNKT